MPKYHSLTTTTACAQEPPWLHEWKHKQGFRMCWNDNRQPELEPGKKQEKAGAGEDPSVQTLRDNDRGKEKSMSYFISSMGKKWS